MNASANLPAAGFPTSKALRWGFIGCGKIANDFAIALRWLPEHSLVAVATSSDQKRADEFADLFSERGRPKAYGNYDLLVQDPNVQVVYVNTTHNFHYDNVKLALSHGKHVLCEKALTLNAAQATELVELARRNKLFFMEGMWTRFIPPSNRVREIIASGQIGDVKFVSIDFGFVNPRNNPAKTRKRLVDPKLAGGALLDIGVYTIAYASMVFQGKAPVAISAMGGLTEQGVDHHTSMNLKFGDEEFAQLTCTLNTKTPCEAIINGTKGRIRVQGSFHVSEGIEIYIGDDKQPQIEKYPRPDILGPINQQRALRPDSMKDDPTYIKASSQPLEFNFGSESAGFIYEAEEVRRCIENNLLECQTMPHNESLQIMRVMDEIRRQLGIEYPDEFAVPPASVAGSNSTGNTAQAGMNPLAAGSAAPAAVNT